MSEALQMMQENMEALERGEELPHQEDLKIHGEEQHKEEPQEESEVQEELNLEPEEKPNKAPEHMTEDEWVASGRKAEDYLTQEQFDKVGDLKDESPTKLAKKVVGMEKTLQDFMQQQKQILEDNAKRVREETIAELEAQKKEAIEVGDTEKAIDLHDKINQQKEEPKQEPVDGNQGFINDWYAKNSDWFNIDQSATGLMNVELQRAEREGLPISEGFARAEAKVKKQFSYLFGEAQEEVKPTAPIRPTSITEKGARKSSNTKSYRFSDLPDEVQGMARTVAKQCNMSEEEYVKSYLGE